MMQDCLHLDGEQAGYLGRLEVGWAVAKLQGRWFLPFLVKLPLVRVNKGSVTDQDIRQRFQAMTMPADQNIEGEDDSSGVISGQEGDSSPPGGEDEVLSAIPLEAKEDENMEEDRWRIRLTTQERQFLNHVWTHPTLTVTQRYSSLALSSRGGTGLQKSLHTKRLVVPLSISIGRGRTKILSLTDKGKAILGITEPDADRLGGPEHRYWTKRLAAHLRGNDYDVVEEYPVGGGKTIDLVATKEGRRIAFEVETGKSDAAANVAKCLAVGIQQVVVVPTSPAILHALARYLPVRPQVRLLTCASGAERLMVNPNEVEWSLWEPKLSGDTWSPQGSYWSSGESPEQKRAWD